MINLNLLSEKLFVSLELNLISILQLISKINKIIIHVTIAFDLLVAIRPTQNKGKESENSYQK